MMDKNEMLAVSDLSPRAQQVVGLIMWMDRPDREIVMPRSQFYARLHFYPRNENMMAIQKAVADVVAELRGSIFPEFNIRVGDNDLGEQEQLFTITY
ncbi:hypothetical protein [Lacticaseibacillus hulanensis]|uniref:hypothetical protein n=1 Tax=Lacticaseibacillus hulanensis TaxID=2493111 RepID=UPI000FD8F7C2|nr:hypothetical protein [Lacticaseibacillus hulanensis]